MWHIFFFRLFVLFTGFVYSAWRWGDWKNADKYYPTVLFMMIVNLGTSYLTYHHALWNYAPDAVFKTHTILEMINCFIILPAVGFLYLSRYPVGTKFQQFRYIALWVFIFSSLEFIDCYLIGGIYYTHGWSWLASTIFDVAIFVVLRLHYVRPAWAWLLIGLIGTVIVLVFDFASAEMK